MQRGFQATLPKKGAARISCSASPATPNGPGLLNQLIRYETLLTAAQYLSFCLARASPTWA
ncbi:MAG: hypothetical protein WKG07_07705 [Hymenobacter sp.]